MENIYISVIIIVCLMLLFLIGMFLLDVLSVIIDITVLAYKLIVHLYKKLRR